MRLNVRMYLLCAYIYFMYFCVHAYIKMCVYVFVYMYWCRRKYVCTLICMYECMYVKKWMNYIYVCV